MEGYFDRDCLILTKLSLFFKCYPQISALLIGEGMFYLRCSLELVLWDCIWHVGFPQGCAFDGVGVLATNCGALVSPPAAYDAASLLPPIQGCRPRKALNNVLLNKMLWVTKPNGKPLPFMMDFPSLVFRHNVFFSIQQPKELTFASVSAGDF